MIRTFHKRIPFAHIRNIKVSENGDFFETSHLTSDGSLDIAEIVKAYHDVGFDGYYRLITVAIFGVKNAAQDMDFMTEL